MRRFISMMSTGTTYLEMARLDLFVQNVRGQLRAIGSFSNILKYINLLDTRCECIEYQFPVTRIDLLGPNKMPAMVCECLVK